MEGMYSISVNVVITIMVELGMRIFLMTNEEFLDYVACVACHVDNAKELEYARKLIAVAKAAKDYVEGRSVEFGTLELEDLLEWLERE